MPAEELDLDKLLQPISTARFFSDYWEKQYLFLERRNPDYFQRLMTRADLETLISESDMRYPALQLARGGGFLSPEAYTHNVKHGAESFLGVPDLSTINDLYRQGATVVLPAIHRTWSRLGRLCEKINRRLDHVAHANAYITPGNAAGFTPHYDVHEVFVLQIAGKKQWSIYRPSIELPHRSQVFDPKTYKPTELLAQIDLDAGDLLYLPRGFIHSTTTSDSYSAHITMGITVYTWVDLAKEFLASAIDNPALRRALPAGFASRSGAKQELTKNLAGAVEAMRAGAVPEKLVETFTSRIRSTYAPPREIFQADVAVIGPASILKSPSPETYTITEDGDKTILEFQNMRYHVPTPMASTLRTMCTFTTFKPSELSGHLNLEGALGFSRYLRGIGFLTLVT